MKTVIMFLAVGFLCLNGCSLNNNPISAISAAKQQSEDAVFESGIQFGLRAYLEGVATNTDQIIIRAYELEAEAEKNVAAKKSAIANARQRR